MSLKLVHIQAAKKFEPFYVIELRIFDKLTVKDYDVLAPVLDILSKHHARIFAELIDFSGWMAGALWGDTKFAPRNFNGIDRIALVGEKYWNRRMALFCKPFTSAEIRYFDSPDINLAKEWIWERIEETISI